MKPAPFQYHTPQSLTEALDLLAEHGYDAKALAGGQSLVPAMNFRLAQPAVLIDLNGLSEMSGISQDVQGRLRIRAMTRQRTVERSTLVAQRAPLIAEAMPYIAHPQIRNRGTLGGSLAHNDPASELPAIMVALDAQLWMRNRGGERWVGAADFFQGIFSTALAPDELLVDVAIPPLQPRTGFAFEEMARRHGDYALAGCAARVTLGDRGTVMEARLVFFSVGDGPVASPAAVNVVRGQTPTAEAIRAAAEAVDGDIDPPTDIHASAAFRRHLAKTLARRALTRAVERAGAELSTY